jgi:ribosomal protein S9
MKVNDGGMSCLAKAARLAISRALISFLSIDEIEKLRVGKYQSR